MPAAGPAGPPEERLDSASGSRAPPDGESVLGQAAHLPESPACDFSRSAGCATSATTSDRATDSCASSGFNRRFPGRPASGNRKSSPPEPVGGDARCPHGRLCRSISRLRPPALSRTARPGFFPHARRKVAGPTSLLLTISRRAVFLNPPATAQMFNQLLDFFPTTSASPGTPTPSSM